MENGGIAELSMHCTNTVHLKFFIISFKRRQVHVFNFHRHLPFKETSWPPCRTILPLGKYFSLFDRDLLTFRKKFIVLYVLDF